MNEEDLIRFLKGSFKFQDGKGIGDDASVRRNGQETGLGFRLVAKDIFVEGTHFNLDYFSLAQAAEKAVGANVSDMAAMGGQGREIYLGLGFPTHTSQAEVKEAFRGIRSGCRRWKLQLAGGDLSRAPCWFFSVTIIGYALRPVYRDGARHGDIVGMVGRTGESALGLQLLNQQKPDPLYTRRHIRVAPHWRRALILGPLASAMIDVSDGLVKDLQRILTASQKGATIHVDALPITRGMRECCRRNGLDAEHLALNGGEDYALLFTMPPDDLRLLENESIPLSIIGRIHDKPRKLRLKKGKELMSPPPGGYDHFKSD